MAESVPEEMNSLLHEAAMTVKNSKKVFAFSHIDADGISALAIIALMLEREGKEYKWKNIHQINSETIVQIAEDIRD
ncbi:MAG: hypothetical protein ACFFBJ_07545, partial [Promethearchaeota archaeon]